MTTWRQKLCGGWTAHLTQQADGMRSWQRFAWTMLCLFCPLWSRTESFPFAKESGWCAPLRVVVCVWFSLTGFHSGLFSKILSPQKYADNLWAGRCSLCLWPPCANIHVIYSIRCMQGYFTIKIYLSRPSPRTVSAPNQTEPIEISLPSADYTWHMRGWGPEVFTISRTLRMRDPDGREKRRQYVLSCKRYA